MRDIRILPPADIPESIILFALERLKTAREWFYLHPRYGVLRFTR